MQDRFIYTNEKTAILVDGGFYKRRATRLFGDKTPQDRATELITYCHRHLKQDNGTRNNLYRIFYYDCEPLNENVYHPLLKQDVYIGNTEIYEWNTAFLDELTRQRKVALRMGVINSSETSYTLNKKVVNSLFRGERTLESITENDFVLDMKQKGVDMKIGLDIASLAHKKQVSQIVLIAGDSDFVPAAKHARREGIDFILDPMRQSVKPDLGKHVDGLRSRTFRFEDIRKDKLHVDHEKANKQCL